MSTISSGTTLTTALVQTGDTTGDLVIKTGASNTTAVTINTAGAIGVGSSPSYGSAGQYLQSAGNAAPATWATVPAATPGGSTTQVQFNSAGAFGGSANLTFNGTTLIATDITDSSLTPGRVVFPTTGGNLTGSADLFWDSANVRLGVGTASPAFPLDVAGAIRGNSWIGRANTSVPSADAAIYRPADNTIGFSTANTERMRIDSSGNLLFNSGYGSVATAYGCRAWVNFNGQGTVAIRASGNVSSITDLGTGSYTLNFSTAMPDANYSVVGSSTSLVGTSATYVVTTFRRDTDTRVGNTPSATTFSTCSDTSVALDVADVNVSVFR